LCVGGVVWGHEGWEEGQVHAEGVLGHGSASANLFAEVFGGGLRECSELVRLAIVFQDVEIVDVQFPALLRC
jgi:hypothetical protein